MLVVPCDVENHIPKAGAGYMLFPGFKLTMARTELLEQDPELDLDGPKGCCGKICNRFVFEALKRWET